MIRACRASSAGLVRCAIIRKPTVSMPSSRASPKCWMDTSASVQWVAILATDAPASRAPRRSSIVPMPGTSSTAIFAWVASSAPGRDQLDLVLAGEAVVERRAAQAVAVRDLDDLDARRVQRVHGGADLLLGELVRHRVTAVAQGRVGDPELPRACGRRGGHAVTAAAAGAGSAQLARRRGGPGGAPAARRWR